MKYFDVQQTHLPPSVSSSPSCKMVHGQGMTLDVFIPDSFTAFFPLLAPPPAFSIGEGEPDQALEAPTILITLPQQVTRASQEHIQAMKRGMNSENTRKYLFTLCASELLSRFAPIQHAAILTVLRTYQLHHILPKLWGGTNDPDNITLVPPDLHLLLHRFMDRQLSCAHSPGGTLWIPRHPFGRRVWGWKTTKLTAATVPASLAPAA